MKKLHVLFVVPPLISIEELTSDNPRHQCATNSSVPIGILSIAAYVGKHVDVHFSVLDLNIELSDRIESGGKIDWNSWLISCLQNVGQDKKFDLVGISAIFNSNAAYLSSIAESAKNLWPGVLVVTGGGVPTNIGSYVFDLAPSIDAIAVGEGEISFLDLIQAKDKLIYLEQAPGWTTRKRLQADEIPVMKLIDDLDEIPFLRYDLIEFGRYQKSNRYHGEKKKEEITASIMTSRGCPYRCNFCSTQTVHGRRVRYHRPRRIIEDIRRLKETYGVSIILIEDDLFLSRKQNALQILDGLAREGLVIEFPNGLTIKHLSDEMIEAMKKAGLKMATLAVESGS